MVWWWQSKCEDGMECMLEIIKSSQTDVFVTIVICMNELCDCVEATNINGVVN